MDSYRNDKQSRISGVSQTDETVLWQQSDYTTEQTDNSGIRAGLTYMYFRLSAMRAAFGGASRLLLIE